jgi:hypothetical protein
MNCLYSRKNGWNFTFVSKNLCIQGKTFTFLEKIDFGQGLKILIEGKFTTEMNLIDSKIQFNETKLYLLCTPSTRYPLKEKEVLISRS